MPKIAPPPCATLSVAGTDAFRRDIKALRAFSVIAVLGYCFEFSGFSGGFVGVDVFLMITDHLMTIYLL
jgi:peptidoglycan/LPS O-acetylase OafA/YrhL